MGSVRTPSGPATFTVAPTPSIQAAPVEPVTRVSTSTPQSAAVDCMTPTVPLRMRKCTTKPSSDVMDERSTTWTRCALTPSNSPSVTRIWSISCDPCAHIQPPRDAASAHQSGTTASGSASTGTCMSHVAMRGRRYQPLTHDPGQSRLAGVPAELRAEHVDDPGRLGGSKDSPQPRRASR